MLMQYSLVSRFEGCLWGSILGEWLGLAAQASRSTPAGGQGKQTIYQWQPRGQIPEELVWSRVALQLVQEIIRSPNAHLPSLTTRVLTPFSPDQINSETFAIATLPIALYYHDDLNRQRHYLGQVLDSLSVDSSSRDWGIIFAYTVAQAVKGQLQPQHFMSQLLAYYRVAMTEETSSVALVLEQLQQIERCQAEMASLETILARFSQFQGATIAVALLCFLQSPDHFRVALTRSAYFSQLAPWSNAQALCSLVGALVGAARSSASIPPSWKIDSAISEISDSPIQQVSFLSRVLYASWSGSFAPTAIAQSVAVAAPWVIRGR